MNTNITYELGDINRGSSHLNIYYRELLLGTIHLLLYNAVSPKYKDHYFILNTNLEYASYLSLEEDDLKKMATAYLESLGLIILQ